MEMTPRNKVLLVILITIQHIYTWEIPQLPAGKRVQFYLINEDGGYKYGYDTGSGAFAKQSGDSANQVEGHYGYKDITGHDIDLKYTAGVQGFVPIGLDQAGPHLSNRQAFPYQPSYASSFRSQSVLNPDGSYSFSYSTNDQARHESADASGNVQGNFWYINNLGKHDLSYIAGEETGFQPTGGSLSIPNGLLGKTGAPNTGYIAPNIDYHAPDNSFEDTTDDQVNTGDASYNFGYNTDDAQRQESSDAEGNVKGSYSYKNKAGQHDLSYIAGSKTGFVATGGSLATPNGLPNTNVPISSRYDPSSSLQVGSSGANIPEAQISEDGSYTFGYNTDDSQRQETSDAQGNVKGSYSYKNKAGQHDLSYIAGSKTGFVATGGSLATPNGLPNTNVPISSRYDPSSSLQDVSSGANNPEAQISGDGSYTFGYNTDDSQRQEFSDAQGNVKGSYSYKNKAGQHDLSYIAGAKTGFVATGGSLATPNGLPNTNTPINSRYYQGSSIQNDFNDANNQDEQTSEDASYSFGYNTDDSQREESSDAQGNVKGSYSYKNEAGQHDLSYIAGAETGFVATGGNLATSNGLPNTNIPTASRYSSDGSNNQDSQISGDGSYSFGYNNNDSQRQETSDAQGNIKGSYSYKNKEGEHDLSYIAGSKTGFITTGGSLATPNGLTSSNIPSRHTFNDGINQEIQNPGDGSYSFTIDTNEYQRKESSDTAGNVEGRYSYKNDQGTHDLSYKAGAKTGFLPIGGSLSVPNGLKASKNGPNPSNLASKGTSTQSGDGSYSFTIDTPDYQREEMGDPTGNVKGKYSYSDKAGQYDLSFVAGAETGFLPTGGNLKDAPGVPTDSVLKAVEFMNHGHMTSKIDGVVLKTFLPDAVDMKKYGYILQTK